MLNNIPLSRILFLDIETVPAKPAYEDLDQREQYLWGRKQRHLDKEAAPGALYERAGIFAEFGRIICISVGFVHEENGRRGLRLKSFFGEDEKKLLQGFLDLLNKKFAKPQHLLCAHNGKEFDYPYIARRCLIRQLPLPRLLDIAGKKPWEVPHLDTLELWKFGDYKHYTSLDLLTYIFSIPTPKDDISGADVARVFYQEKDINRIVRYCEKDVAATVQLFLRYRLEPLLPENTMQSLTEGL